MSVTDFRRGSIPVVVGEVNNLAGVSISSNGGLAAGYGLVGVASNIAQWDDVFSFGSNATDIGSISSEPAAGIAIASNASSYHTHRGVGAIVAASSNTLYGSVGFAAGANVSLTEADGTITIGSTGGGGGGGAPTDAQYIVGTADSTLTAEKVKQPLYKNYDPDEYPSSGLTLSDEFDDDSLDGAWSWDTSPSGTVSESVYTGFLHIDGGSDATPTALNLTRSFTPGAAAFTVVAKLAMTMANTNHTGLIGIRVLTSAPANIWQMLLASDGTTTASDAHRIIGTSGSMTPGDQLGDGFYYLMIQRDSSTNYKGYYSRDGLVWTYIGGSSVAGTVALVGFVLQTDTDNTEPQHVIDFIRVFDSQTKKIGA